jgi:hypothetical protein
MVKKIRKPIRGKWNNPQAKLPENVYNESRIFIEVP